jgi:hypothetical protein
MPPRLRGGGLAVPAPRQQHAEANVCRHHTLPRARCPLQHATSTRVPLASSGARTEGNGASGVPPKRAEDEAIQLRIPCGLDRVEPAPQQVRRCGVAGSYAEWPRSKWPVRGRGPPLPGARCRAEPRRAARLTLLVLQWLPVDTGSVVACEVACSTIPLHGVVA